MVCSATVLKNLNFSKTVVEHLPKNVPYRVCTRGDQKVRGKELLNRIAFIDFYENS